MSDDRTAGRVATGLPIRRHARASTNPNTSAPYWAMMFEAERKILLGALAQTDGRYSLAARLLGVSASFFCRRSVVLDVMPAENVPYAYRPRQRRKMSDEDKIERLRMLGKAYAKKVEQLKEDLNAKSSGGIPDSDGHVVDEHSGSGPVRTEADPGNRAPSEDADSRRILDSDSDSRDQPRDE
jgi:hypothetical protein